MRTKAKALPFSFSLLSAFSPSLPRRDETRREKARREGQEARPSRKEKEKESVLFSFSSPLTCCCCCLAVERLLGGVAGSSAAVAVFRVFFQVVDSEKRVSTSFREWKREYSRARERERERERERKRASERERQGGRGDGVTPLDARSFFSQRWRLRQRCNHLLAFCLLEEIHSPTAAAATRRFLGLEVIRSAAEAGRSAAAAAVGRRGRTMGLVRVFLAVRPLCVRCLPVSAPNRAQERTGTPPVCAREEEQGTERGAEASVVAFVSLRTKLFCEERRR